MGREVKRVPLDFAHPIGTTWPGYLSPDSLNENPCGECDARGYSPRARYLHSLWYGYVPFRPEDNGSVPLTTTSPAVRAFAEGNVQRAPEFYGSTEDAVEREARRLCDLWNGQWSHHLNAEDVAALVAADRLWDLTRTFVPGEGWQTINPPAVPTPEQVNSWHISGFGHDSINAHVVIDARCAREGVPDRCEQCGGHGSFEAYPGQRADAEAWERTEPPTGDGWQLWETVSEGAPISPVFDSAEDLARWMASRAKDDMWFGVGVPTYDTALAFVRAGWAPTGVSSPSAGFVDGVEFIGREASA